MRFVIISGPSGAGKTQALHSFEDAGYYTADNLPPRLLPELIEFCRNEGWKRAAVIIDARSGHALRELPAVLASIDQGRDHVEVLFLDADDSVLIQRFKESRRPHPLWDRSRGGEIVEAIRAERSAINHVRALADHVIDTSSLTAAQLRDELLSTYSPATRPGLRVLITSFGFKHGLPLDADLVFDVRFLSNPHYMPELHDLNGCDTRVSDYIHADPLTRGLQQHIDGLVDFALPEYRREGRAYLNIAIGCTGGQHRSVVLARDLADRLAAGGVLVSLRHRDMVAARSGKTPDSAEPEASS